MSDAATVAATIRARLGRIKRGSLCMFGHGYGRPCDNIHHVVDASADGNCRRVTLDAADVLEVWDPADVVADAGTFRIGRASRVRWQSVEYAPRADENEPAAELL